MKKYKILDFSKRKVLKIIFCNDIVEAGEIAEDLFGYSVHVEKLN